MAETKDKKDDKKEDKKETKQPDAKAALGFQLTIQHCLQPYTEMLTSIIRKLETFQKGYHLGLRVLQYRDYPATLAAMIKACTRDPILMLATGSAENFWTNLRNISSDRHFGLLFIVDNLLTYYSSQEKIFNSGGYEASEFKPPEAYHLWHALHSELQKSFWLYFGDSIQTSRLNYQTVKQILLQLQEILVAIKDTNPQNEQTTARQEQEKLRQALQQQTSQLVATKENRERYNRLAPLIAEMRKKMDGANKKYENGDIKAAIDDFNTIATQLDQAGTLNLKGYELLMQCYAEQMRCYAVLGDEKAIEQCYRTVFAKKISTMVPLYTYNLTDKIEWEGNNYWYGSIYLEWCNSLQRQAATSSLSEEARKKLLGEAQQLSEKALKIIEADKNHAFTLPTQMLPLAYHTAALLREENDPKTYRSYLETANALLLQGFINYDQINHYGRTTQIQVYQMLTDINYRLIPFANNITEALTSIVQTLKYLSKLPNNDYKNQMDKKLSHEKETLENQIKTEAAAKKAAEDAAKAKELKEQKEREEAEKSAQAAIAADIKREEQLNEGHLTVDDTKGSINQPRPT